VQILLGHSNIATTTICTHLTEPTRTSLKSLLDTLMADLVIEVADVFRRFADDYLRAIADILACRIQALGGHLWPCDHCRHEVFSYHRSCRIRACPKCHTNQTKDWLADRQAEMLPVPYFHVTVTVPAELQPRDMPC